MPSVRNKLAAVTAVAAGAALVISTGGAGAASQADPGLPNQLVRGVTLDKMQKHLIAFQRYADQNNATRAAGTTGHAKSADYIAAKLEAAGFTVTKQQFPFVFDQTLSEKLTVAGNAVPIVRMSYSASGPEGGVTAQTVAVPVDATPGCEASDYTGLDVTGKIAVIKRGGCTFAIKQQLAAEAGAVGAVIYNNTAGNLNGTLGDPTIGKIPTGGVTQANGESLAAAAPQEATLDIRGLTEDRTTYNVLAETKTGKRDNVVMAGAHLDSVAAGPGINDNGSGSAALLTTALEMGGSPKVNNAVRFAWWSAEELGLIGSEYYVEHLTDAEQLDIALYLNFDMIASPNAGYFAYDGDDSDGVGAGPGPEGSAAIEKKFVDFISDRKDTPVEGTDFTGRSDYGPFIAAGIPSGGLFTGAEVLKTDAQVEKWGGEAGVAYDKCYHQRCDTLSNIDRRSFGINGDAVAFVLAKFALSTKDVNGITANMTKSDAVKAAERADEHVVPKPLEKSGKHTGNANSQPVVFK